MDAQPAIRVDFYVHDGAGFDALARTACRIAEKAYLQAQRVYIHTDSEAVARELDVRLWTFHDRSFVPQALAGAAADEPVLIGAGAVPENPDDVLINLASHAPAFYDRCTRIADLVDGGDEQRRLEGRERFRWYRERGLKPETHKL
jgi:DNA polymerase-3 subunit chi